MKALLLAVLLAQAADAPLVVEERPAMVLKAGEVVPFDGVCLTNGLAIRQAQRVAAAEAERDALKASHIGWPLVVGAVVGALLVGGAVGAGVAVATRAR